MLSSSIVGTAIAEVMSGGRDGCGLAPPIIDMGVFLREGGGMAYGSSNQKTDPFPYSESTPNRPLDKRTI